MRVYIGDSENYLSNTQCSSKPFMDAENTASFTTDQSGAKTWNYGFEAWCNKQGRYTTFEIDMTHLSG